MSTGNHVESQGRYSGQERRRQAVLELLTVKEVADFCRVGVATVKYWMAMRKLKVVKLGKHPLVTRDELLRFVQSAQVR